MKFLALEEEIEGKSSKDFTPHLENEARRVWQLIRDGLIREIYFDENHNAILILECRDESTVQEVLDTLPLVQEGLIKFTVKTLFPYDGFERIFK